MSKKPLLYGLVVLSVALIAFLAIKTFRAPKPGSEPNGAEQAMIEKNREAERLAHTGTSGTSQGVVVPGGGESHTDSNTTSNGIAQAPGAPTAPVAPVPNGAGNGVGANGAVPANPNGTFNPAAPEVAKAEPPKCYKVSYKHKELESHNDGEVCGHHKNLIRLSHENVQASNACVRVGGVPVKFEARKNGQELLLDPVAGPDTLITVTYCVGEGPCKMKEKCQVTAKAPKVKKKDEFLDAIGGDADGKELGNWDGKGGNDAADQKLNGALDPAIRREIAQIDAPKPKSKADMGLFSDWLKEEEEEVNACL